MLINILGIKMRITLKLCVLMLLFIAKIYAQPTITTGPVSDIMLCPGANFSITFTTSDYFNAGNIFTAQLSGPFGTFTSPVNIGQWPGNTSAVIDANIPANATPGTQYRVRVTGSVPTVTGSDNGVDITIANLPNTQITQGSATVCEGTPANYTASSVPTGFVNEWSVTSGHIVSSSTGGTVTVVWESFSSGIVTLKQRIPSGLCEKMAYYNVVINSKPMIMAAGDTLVCARTSHTYSTSVPAGYANLWLFPGGTSPYSNTLTKVPISWENSGTYTVTLIQTKTATGCSATYTIPVRVLAIPKVEVNGPLNACPGEIIKYTTVKTPGIINYWEPKYGIRLKETETEITIQWVKNFPIGEVKLIKVISQTGCSDSFLLKVNVNPLPAPAISGTKEPFNNEISVYTVNTPSNISNIWSVTGGSIQGSSNQSTVVILWGVAGVGSLQVNQVNLVTQCKDSSKIPITIKKGSSLVITGSEKVCAGDSKVYSTQKKEGKNHEWFINGTNGSIIGDSTGEIINVLWSASGSGTVNLVEITKQINTRDTIFLPVTVFDKPPQPTISRSGDTLFSSSTFGCQWFIGGVELTEAKGQYFYIPKLKAVYTLQITDSNGCSSPISNNYDFETNVPNPDIINNLNLFPNPVDAELNVDLGDLLPDGLSIQIKDILGETVYDYDFASRNVRRLNLNTSGFAEGFYIIIIKTGEQKYFMKIIVKH
ncbi:MAG: hypothetical protein HW421_1295 [Ignavibacteria bacterium]|nr:hypothetical protein [Ignavibacteria bacterium]